MEIPNSLHTVSVCSDMKILTLCSGGNNRSVATSWLLKDHGHDAIPAGLNYNSPETIKILCGWADVIILMDSSLLHLVPKNKATRDKLKIWHVGPDVWNTNSAPELWNKVIAYADADGLLK